VSTCGLSPSLIAFALGLVSALAIYAFFQRTAALEQARIAQLSEKRANDARDQADGLITFMLHNLRDKLRPIGRLDVLDDVAKKAKEYLDNLPKDLITASRLKQKIAMLVNLGEVQVGQGKLQDALEAYQQGLAISKGLAEQDQSNPVWQADLSVSYEKVGNVLQAQGKLPEALDLYQQDLAIAKRLAEQDKSNSVWQRDLVASYARIGGVLVEEGRLPEALDLYQQSLAMAERLAEQDKSDSDSQNYLAASYERVGDVLVTQGKAWPSVTNPT
jgi:tetratricopeptide (TPR) repeat protein